MPAFSCVFITMKTHETERTDKKTHKHSSFLYAGWCGSLIIPRCDFHSCGITCKFIGQVLFMCQSTVICYKCERQICFPALKKTKQLDYAWGILHRWADVQLGRRGVNTNCTLHLSDSMKMRKKRNAMSHFPFTSRYSRWCWLITWYTNKIHLGVYDAMWKDVKKLKGCFDFAWAS